MELITTIACTLLDYDNGGLKADHEAVYFSYFCRDIRLRHQSLYTFPLLEEHSVSQPSFSYKLFTVCSIYSFFFFFL